MKTSYTSFITTTTFLQLLLHFQLPLLVLLFALLILLPLLQNWLLLLLVLLLLLLVLLPWLQNLLLLQALLLLLIFILLLPLIFATKTVLWRLKNYSISDKQRVARPDRMKKFLNLKKNLKNWNYIFKCVFGLNKVLRCKRKLCK